jgi:TonB-dependent SusC/RagA subfamily outer membrane receptor
MASHILRRLACGVAIGASAVGAACHHAPPPDGAASAALPDDTTGGPRRGGRSATDDDWAGATPARVEELFAARFPGVRVTSVPGQGIAVQIRGATSVNGSNDPLYVIDGFPIETGGGGLIAINPSDIARIEVLKDAGAVAEYGVRGANGVVLISTKRNR